MITEKLKLSMQIKAIFTGALLTASLLPTQAFLTYTFPGWNKLTQYSPQIMVVHCTKTAEWIRVIDGAEVVSRGATTIDIRVVSVLKGVAVASGTAATIDSAYSMLEGENYLVFATGYSGNHCQALDGYRVLPLGHAFQTNALAGKSLEQELQVVLHHGIGQLDAEIKRDQAEKVLLEQGLQEITGAGDRRAPATNGTRSGHTPP